MITSGWRGPATRIVDADPENVRLIRAWISSAITRHGCPVDAADAALAVGELFTNAAKHGPRGQVLVGYCLWPGGMRIVVCDRGSYGTPEIRPVTSTDEGGRGLQVVEAITAQWGCFCFADAGHLIVWCDLGQPLRPCGNDAWAWLHRAISADVPLCTSAPDRSMLERGLAASGLTVTASSAVAGAGHGAAS